MFSHHPGTSTVAVRSDRVLDPDRVRNAKGELRIERIARAASGCESSGDEG
jgi:hypothetical protein